MRRFRWIPLFVGLAACSGADAGTMETAPSQDAPTPPASNVTASTDDADRIVIEWLPPSGAAATGYILERDGIELVTLPAGSTAFADATAAPGGALPPADLMASDATRSDGVALSWRASATRAGAAHVYRVIALYGTRRSEPSVGAVGHRAAPAVSYEFRRNDDAVWSPAGTTGDYLDADAPLGTMSAQPTARDEYRRGVAVLGIASLTVVPPPATSYVVRAMTNAGATESTARAIGRRSVGLVTRVQWERSSADSAAAYANVENATGMLAFDPAPPSTGRFYRARLALDGVADSSTDAVRVERASFKAVASGGDHVCAVRVDGRVLCWGHYGASRMLAIGEGAVDKIVAGGETTCAIRSADKSTVCWGGQGSVPSGQTFADVGTIGSTTCGIRAEDGKVLCWGNGFGVSAGAEPSGSAFKAISGKCAIRQDDTVACWGLQFAPAWAPSGTFASVSSSGSHACGLRLSDRKVVCWRNDGAAPIPPDPSAATFKSVTAGTNHACGIRDDDRVVCWGTSDTGQAPPTPSTDTFSSVSASSSFTCLVRTDGRLTCWGLNDPPPLPSHDVVKAVATSGSHTCYLRSDDKAICLGSPWYGEAPPGPSALAFKSIAAASAQTCAVGFDGGVSCWGLNNNGRLTVPTNVGFRSVSLGGSHVCGVESMSGRVRCWGDTAGRAPETITDDAFDIVSAGPNHTCAVRSNDKKIVCWGTAVAAYVPPEMADATFTSVSVGASHTCALRSDHEAVCWGGVASPTPGDGPFASITSGPGESCGVRLADKQLRCWGYTDFSGGPRPGGIDAFESVSMGGYAVCAIRSSDRKMLCWAQSGGWGATPGLIP